MSRVSSEARIGVLGAVLAGGFVVVLLHLWLLMVHEQDVWARRSYENRWAFRSVPSQRGAITDRDGRVLTFDQATSEVSIHYERFRLYNVVGAAVHAATEWTRVLRGQGEVRFCYREGAVGPTAAVEELLAMPVAALRRGVLSKEEAKKLWVPVVTVLSGCSGLSRSQVYTALREAAEAGRRVGVGDVLVSASRAALLQAFDERLRALQELDRRIADAKARRDARLGRLDAVRDSLSDTLEFLRVASLNGQRHVVFNEAGEGEEGSLVEQVTRVVAADVDFELAAALRVDAPLYVGLRVTPSVTRVHATEPFSSLRLLLGKVVDYDRTIGKGEEQTWFGEVAERLDESWLDELVPPGVVDSDEARRKLQETARRRYEYAVLSRERRGTTGLEAAADAQLSGRLGMRFVEHDAKRREQLLWSHLRVESGEDVAMTIDAGAQLLAEYVVRAMCENVRSMHGEEADRRRVEAALALVDAQTGDILCYAGAPIDDETERVPGLSWSGNGAIGSVVKPLVMLEQLEAERLGLPHTPRSQMTPCGGALLRPEIRARAFACDGTHGAKAFDPAYAIAQSCNVFFYQAGMGLGDAGLRRALERFGMLSPQDGSPFAACWQPKIGGVTTARPRMNAGSMPLIQRSIGYAIEATPLHVARAYAGLGALALPTLGLRRDETRPRVSLEGYAASIGVVRDGLRACVQSGTAARLGPLLKDLDAHAKTGTAEVSARRHNNAWFAGFLPWTSAGGVQLAFASVCYWVPDGEHGADIAGKMVVDLLDAMWRDPRLREVYLTRRDG